MLSGKEPLQIHVKKKKSYEIQCMASWVLLSSQWKSLIWFEHKGYI